LGGKNKEPIPSTEDIREKAATKEEKMNFIVNTRLIKDAAGW
jgi:hypothetical protein